MAFAFEKKNYRELCFHMMSIYQATIKKMKNSPFLSELK